MTEVQRLTNRVIYGDCIPIMQGMESETVDLVVTDPPYLVKYRPRDGRECTNDDNDAWLVPAFEELYRVLKPNRLCACFYGWPAIERFMHVWKEVGFRPVSHLIWLKQHCSRKGYTRTYHEVGFLLAKGNPPRPQNPPADVLPWEYTGNGMHPNEKPVVSIKPLIEAYSKRDDIVLDPFAGSGTTAVAARSCHRRFIAIEKDYHYFEVAAYRLHQ